MLLQISNPTVFLSLCFFLFFRTIVLIALFSQYLTNVKVPVPGYSKDRGGFYVGRYPLFSLFPVSIVGRAGTAKLN